MSGVRWALEESLAWQAMDEVPGLWWEWPALEDALRRPYDLEGGYAMWAAIHDALDAPGVLPCLVLSRVLAIPLGQGGAGP